jgi:nucleotide-binding universal stress UspA family protein
MDAKLILHPTDGSVEAKKALDYAAQLAVSTGAKLLVLYVQTRHGRDSVPPSLEELERVEHIRLTESEVLHGAAQSLVDSTAASARKLGVKDVEAVTKEGDPARVIVDVARNRGVDTIVMGSRGLGGVSGLILGAVAYKVAHAAPCTCIIVR